MSNIENTIAEMRNMRESYDELSRKLITPLKWTDEEAAKQAIDDITSEIYIIPK